MPPSEMLARLTFLSHGSGLWVYLLPTDGLPFECHVGSKGREKVETRVCSL